MQAPTGSASLGRRRGGRALGRRRGRAAVDAGPEPVAGHGHPVPRREELVEVDVPPDREARGAHDAELVCLAVEGAPPEVVGDARAAQLDDGVGVDLRGALALPDVGHAALVVVPEGLGRGVRDLVLGAGSEHPAQVLALLVGHLGGRRLPAHGAVTDGEDLAGLRALHAQAAVDQQAAAVRLAVLLADLLAHRAGEGPHPHAGHPDEHAVVDRLDRPALHLQMHLVFLHLLDHGVQLDVHPLLRQVALHVLADALVEHGKETRQRLHEGDPEVFRDLRVARLEVVADEVRKLAAELDPRGAAAHDDDVEELLHLLHLPRRPGNVRLIDDV
mmetsp:Transcript_79908/g.226219  ORF Transcript_79908/g.226219 Transcript_79908/m.226219 type:complete len:331 (-) Transcript_79908:639-1631(-)